jgi:molybdate transport repressor ModE-like protein
LKTTCKRFEDNAAMPDRRNVLTPDALGMLDAIARTGSFAAAARELGKVPSALTYSVRQLEEALDVLLFDRSSRQAQFTAAGTELLHEGRRLLQELDAVSNRVKRVASGWESELAICFEDILSQPTILDLVEAFCGSCGEDPARGPATRLRLHSEVLAGVWEALISGQVDLAVGISGTVANPGGIEVAELGTIPFVFCVAPHHPLARAAEPIDHDVLVHHRAVAVADSAQRMVRLTFHLLPGQDVLTVPTMRAKLEALLRGLGCGFLPEPMARPHLEAGRFVSRATVHGAVAAPLQYAWRQGDRGRIGLGRALQWWLAQLESPKTRQSLLDRHAGLML